MQMTRKFFLLAILSVTVVGLFLLSGNEDSGTAMESQEKIEVRDRSAASGTLAPSSKTQKLSGLPEQHMDTASRTPVERFNGRRLGSDDSFRQRKAMPKLKIDTAKLRDDSFFTDTPWRIWEGVTAYPKSQGKPNAPVLGEVNGYYVVEGGAVSTPDNFFPQSPMLVVNSRLSIAGVMTGVFTLQLEQGADPELLAQSSDVEMVASFPEINTYLVTSKQRPFDLNKFREFLQAFPQVRSISAEILSRQYAKF